VDVERIREDFPILSRSINGHQLIYFDNAASSLKPIQVVDAIADFYRSHYSNVHRGLHTLSQEASKLYEDAHETLAKFIGATFEEIIFTKNTTEGLNMVAYGWGLKHLSEGDEVIIALMDHHSNMLPWRKLAEYKKVKVKYVSFTSDGDLNYEELQSLITKKTRIIALAHVSNVLGTIIDIKKVAKLAHEVGAIFVVDGAQSVPHIPINVKDMDIDFLAFSGHKMLGPTGIGVLYGRRDLLEKMDVIMIGGGCIDDVTISDVKLTSLPWRFEAGTPHIAGGIGLAKAAEYLMNIGMKNVREHEAKLTEYVLKRLNELENVEVYGPREVSKRSGVVSFNVKGLDPDYVGMILDKHGIAVRTGKHCAHPLHYSLGINGSVRASFYVYNTTWEIDKFTDALLPLIKNKMRA